MKRIYFLTITLAMVFFMLGVHLVLSINPVKADYEQALQQAQKVSQSGVQVRGDVIARYDYRDTPNMGSHYGADVRYKIPSNSESETEWSYAWIALERPAPSGQKLNLLASPDIKNFAINANSDLIPNEKPDEFLLLTGKVLIALPILYLLWELSTLAYSLARGRKRNYARATFPFKNTAYIVGIIALIAFRGILMTISSFTSLAEYEAASDRVNAVREQNNIYIAGIQKKCGKEDERMDDCAGRYKAGYSVHGCNCARWVHFKGKMIDAKGIELDEQGIRGKAIPLLVNENDPRFSYTLSSSKQFVDPYDPFNFVTGPTMVVIAMYMTVALCRQRIQEFKDLHAYDNAFSEPNNRV